MEKSEKFVDTKWVMKEKDKEWSTKHKTEN